MLGGVARAVHIDLARFFTITAVFLVLVAAGLLVSAVHTAHEATWINVGQTQVADLSAIVRPGTPISSLLTGVLGIQPQPTVIEVVAWLIYLVPMLVFVLWPVRRPARSSASVTAAASA